MASDKKMSKSQWIVIILIVVVLGGLGIFRLIDPAGFERCGLKSAFSASSRSAARNDEYLDCRITAKKLYDAGEALNDMGSRYDYTFTCKAKQNVILYDVTVTLGEVVTVRNTGIGKDEKSDRRLDSENFEDKVPLMAGENYEKTGRLVRRHSSAGTRGYIELKGRIQFPDEITNKKADPTAPKTFLKLRTPISG